MMKEITRLRKVADYHKLANLPKPEHPLISLIDYSEVAYIDGINQMTWTQDYYVIGLKRNIPYKFFYGQQQYDFDEGLMTFIAPNQVLSVSDNPNIGHTPSGWLLLIHPDFLWNSTLAQKLTQYDFFEYSIREALFLSEKEESMMTDLLKNIQREYQSNIDKFSQKIIVSQIELLLNYAERFYERQFNTRTAQNKDVFSKFESLLKEYFSNEKQLDYSLPSVDYFADKVNLSASYFSDVLKKETGRSAKDHINDYVIELAKNQLVGRRCHQSYIACQRRNDVLCAIWRFSGSNLCVFLSFDYCVCHCEKRK